MFRVMLAQNNELKIVFTADRNVFQSHPPPTHSISHGSYTTTLPSQRAYGSKEAKYSSLSAYYCLMFGGEIKKANCLFLKAVTLSFFPDFARLCFLIL